RVVAHAAGFFCQLDHGGDIGLGQAVFGERGDFQPLDAGLDHPDQRGEGGVVVEVCAIEEEAAERDIALKGWVGGAGGFFDQGGDVGLGDVGEERAADFAVGGGEIRAERR